MMKNKLFSLAVVLSLFLFIDVSAPAQEEGKFLDKNKITIDIKGMDVVDVLKMLALRSGMNIAVGKNVTGKATLFLKDVNIWDVFEIVLLANDLAYEKKGEVLSVMTQKDYEFLYGERYQDKKQAKVIRLKYAKAANLVSLLNQIKSNAGKVVMDEASNTLFLIDAPEPLKEMENFVKNTDLPLQTSVFSLNYAQADKLLPKLQESITKGLGSINIDERTNKISIRDYPEKLMQLADIISAFDEKTPQVLIDAQIIEIKPSDKFEMGVDWDYWLKKNFRITSSLPIGTTGRLLLSTATSTPTEKGEYKAIVDLLRTIGDTKILSSPRIMVLNNQEAKIHVGTKDAYVTSTTSQSGTGTTVTSQSVNFVDVGIKLAVTPTVNRDGFVTMKLKPEISSATRTDITSEGKITQIPIVTTSETETTVMIRDGITIIIGGLKKDERTKQIKRIPLLGSIPLLGHLFGSTSDELKTTELVILLTPHIMSGEDTHIDFADIKPKAGAVVKMVNGDIVTEKIKTREQEGPTDEYCRLIVEKIKALALFSQPKNKKGEIKVSFVLDSNGQLKDQPIVIASTNDGLNELVTKCITNSSPFPVFPVDLAKKEQIFNITLDYK